MKYLVYSIGQYYSKKDTIQICNNLEEAKKVKNNLQNCTILLDLIKN